MPSIKKASGSRVVAPRHKPRKGGVSSRNTSMNSNLGEIDGQEVLSASPAEQISAKSGNAKTGLESKTGVPNNSPIPDSRLQWCESCVDRIKSILKTKQAVFTSIVKPYTIKDARFENIFCGLIKSQRGYDYNDRKRLLDAAKLNCTFLCQLEHLLSSEGIGELKRLSGRYLGFSITADVAGLIQQILQQVSVEKQIPSRALVIGTGACIGSRESNEQDKSQRVVRLEDTGKVVTHEVAELIGSHRELFTNPAKGSNNATWTRSNYLTIFKKDDYTEFRVMFAFHEQHEGRKTREDKTEVPPVIADEEVCHDQQSGIRFVDIPSWHFVVMCDVNDELRAFRLIVQLDRRSKRENNELSKIIATELSEFNSYQRLRHGRLDRGNIDDLLQGFSELASTSNNLDSLSAISENTEMSRGVGQPKGELDSTPVSANENGAVPVQLSLQIEQALQNILLTNIETPDYRQQFVRAVNEALNRMGVGPTSDSRDQTVTSDPNPRYISDAKIPTNHLKVLLGNNGVTGIRGPRESSKAVEILERALSEHHEPVRVMLRDFVAVLNRLPKEERFFGDFDENMRITPILQKLLTIVGERLICPKCGEPGVLICRGGTSPKGVFQFWHLIDGKKKMHGGWSRLPTMVFS